VKIATKTIEVNNLYVKVYPSSTTAKAKKLLGPISFKLLSGQTLVVGNLPEGLYAEGDIYINEKKVDHLSTHERSVHWGQDIAILPQEPTRALDPLMRSASQVKESHRYVAKRSRKESHRATLKDFKTLGLNGAEKKRPNALSGGMAQRVAFASSTAANAPILLADEPTKGLDSKRKNSIFKLLKKVVTPEGIPTGTLIVITHDISLARLLKGEIIVLKEGNLVESGLTEQVLEQPQAEYSKALINAEPRAWTRRKNQKTKNNNSVLLEANDLTVKRGKRILIENINLKLYNGERIAITGPSGVGKTSFLDTLAGINKPASGNIKQSQALLKTSIQKLYQDPPAAFPEYVTLEKTLKDVARLYQTEWLHVESYLKQLNIDLEILKRRPDEVSGGELQRLSIARVLITEPAIILADEPTSRLDPITQRETLALMTDLAAEKGIAIILVTHDLMIAEKWADRYIHLE